MDAIQLRTLLHVMGCRADDIPEAVLVEMAGNGRIADDYDWEEALAQGTESKGGMSRVIAVLALAPGENDGPNWVAILLWLDDDGQAIFGYLNAGCDNTGWDCHASGSFETYDSLQECISRNTLDRDVRDRLWPDIEKLQVDLDWHLDDLD